MTGFKKSLIVIHELPNLPDYVPFIFDDCSLASLLRIKTSTLWWVLRNIDDQYSQIRKKKKRGYRIIHRPKRHTKAILRRANDVLLEPLQKQLGPHVTAYRTGKSTRDAVIQHIPSCPICEELPLHTTAPDHACPRLGTCIQLDLHDFFPSTRRSWIRKYFKHIGYGHSVSSYLASLFTVTDIPNLQYRKRKAHNLPTRKHFTGVPQGAPTSGAICNLIADYRLDRKIFTMLHQWEKEPGLSGAPNWTYTRYSDDLTLTCKTRLTPAAEVRVKNQLYQIIRDAGYQVNTTKTRSTSGNNQRRHLLGMTFNRHPNYQQDRYRRIRAIVHNCATFGIESQYTKANFGTPAEFINQLRGTLYWIRQINNNKGQTLLDKFLPAVANYCEGDTTCPSENISP